MDENRKSDRMTSGGTVAETIAEWAATVETSRLPDAVVQTALRSFIDVAGLCLAARETNYVRAAKASWDGGGPCTLLGHAQTLDAAGAAFVNGTAAHGEDFDDTFEGTPVHPGAVAVPAVLAACEAHGRAGADLIKGIAIAAEIMCRMALVAPTAQHRAGFHPTAVIGALGAAGGVGAALGCDARVIVNAFGIAGSFASGIIEYLAEGAWTKRLHPGWAAQSGYRAARLAAAGFSGPRTVFEGENGFFKAFGTTGIGPDFSLLTDGLGADWCMRQIAYKPYACGTMCQPFIDAARRLAEGGIVASSISDVLCKVGEGTVHRLWEPRAEKVRPTTAYSAKFSVPYCIAVAMIDRAAGLGQFTDARIHDPGILELAGKVRYQIDPENAYPKNYSGRLKVTLADGTVHETEQPYLRGGAREPLSETELLAKFRANAAFGGWNEDHANALERCCHAIFAGADLSELATLHAAAH
jgi:2-methylcitrate dehydratase PrpD